MSQNNYRYPGARPFELADRSIFFGRRADIQDLARLIRVEQMTLLYAKSGLGKSSLLNAGVMPLLQEKDGFQPLFIRLRSKPNTADYASPVQTAAAVLQQAAADSSSSAALPTAAQQPQHALWLASKRLSLEQPKRQFVWVFDQFEELFSYSDTEIADFARQLAEVLYVALPQTLYEQDNDAAYQHATSLPIKVVFAIRSDRMSLLARIQNHLPNILFRTYELQALTREQAEFAIEQPALKPGDDFITPQFEYTPDAVAAILQHLSGTQAQIEAAPLQIILQYAERLIAQRTASGDNSESALLIRREDLGDLNAVYQNYYAETLNAISPDSNNAQRQQARRLIEDELIFEADRRRLSLYEGRILQFVTPEVLQLLTERHFLRPEPNPTGGYTYEISHDSLVAPILAARTDRRTAEQAEADRFTAERAATERAALEAQLQAERDRAAELERLTQQAQSRTRIAVGVAVLAVLAVLATVVAAASYYYALLLKDAAEANSINATNTLYRSQAKEYMRNGDAFAVIGEENLPKARVQYAKADSVIQLIQLKGALNDMKTPLLKELEEKRKMLGK